MTRGLITSFRTLYKLHTKKRSKAKTHHANIKYVTYRNGYNCLKINAKLKYYNKYKSISIISIYKYKSKKTWGVINTLIGRTHDKCIISQTFKVENKNISSTKDIANDTFVSKEQHMQMKFDYAYFLRNRRQVSVFIAYGTNRSIRSSKYQ